MYIVPLLLHSVNVYLFVGGRFGRLFSTPSLGANGRKAIKREAVPKESGGAGCFGQNLPQIGKVFHQLAPALARSPLRGNAKTRHPSHSQYRFALATANS